MLENIKIEQVANEQRYTTNLKYKTARTYVCLKMERRLQSLMHCQFFVAVRCRRIGLLSLIVQSTAQIVICRPQPLSCRHYKQALGPMSDETVSPSTGCRSQQQHMPVTRGYVQLLFTKNVLSKIAQKTRIMLMHSDVAHNQQNVNAHSKQLRRHVQIDERNRQRNKLQFALSPNFTSSICRGLVLQPTARCGFAVQLVGYSMSNKYVVRQIHNKSKQALTGSRPTIQGGPKKTGPLYIFPNIQKTTEDK